MILLNAEDMEKCISYNEVMDSIEEAYKIYGTGNFLMPERPCVNYGTKQLIFMPCFTENMMGTKILTMFPDNISIGRPAIDGQMIVNNIKTGECLSIMDGKKLTALRTGAAGGVAVKYLSDRNSKSVGIIGAGAQGLYQAIYAINTRPIEKVYIYDAFVKDLNPFIEKLKAKVSRKIECIPCDNTTILLANSDIVMTATMAKEPVLPNDSKLLAGKCFIGVGSYRHDMREFPSAIWDVCENVYVDLEYAMEESGDLSQPLEEGILKKEQVKHLREIFGCEPLKPEEGKSNFFKTVGMALVDIVVATEIYKKANERGIGLKYDL
jgi:ornithine cyclodeaminase/alanine dehydrogenase-like protein (mu-crystallin family)